MVRDRRVGRGGEFTIGFGILGQKDGDGGGGSDDWIYRDRDKRIGVIKRSLRPDL